MKRCSIFLLSVISLQVGLGQSLTLDTINNRKILVVILPARPDTALMGQMTRFQTRHSRQVKVVGIVANASSGASEKNAGSIYDRLSTNGVLLTEGLGSGDSANSPRLSVLKYISNKSRNRQVDRQAEGSMYFLSEAGRLFAQMGPGGSLDSRVADYIVQANVPGEDRH